MRFTFESFGEIVFRADLECRQCTGRKADGTRCSRTTCKYLPMCFQHLRKEMGLVVRPSTIPNAGLGLFAARPFQKDEWIAPVNGERKTRQEINNRYNDPNDLITAPYAVTISAAADEYVDGALQRWVGHYANTHIGQHGQSVKTGTNAKLSIRQTGPWLKATRNIAAGREIFLWYGTAYRIDNHSRSWTR